MEELTTVDALVQLSFLVHGVVAAAGSAHDLSITQVRLLGILRDREPGMAELAGHLGLDKSSVTGLVDRAERRELVRRRAGVHDRRAVSVSLTASGRRLARAVERAVAAEVAALVGVLTATDERRLVQAATHLLQAQQV